MHLFPLYIDTGLDLKHRLLLASGLQLVLATYQFAIAGKCKPGLLRFAVSLPCLAGLVALPAFFRWQQEEVLLRTSLIFTCAWLGTFKVLSMCMNRGPFAQKNLTFIQFLALLYLPIYPLIEGDESASTAKKGRLQDAAANPAKLLMFAAIKLVVLGLVVFTVLRFPLPSFFKHFVYALGLSGFLGLIMDTPASVVTSMIGLRIIPTFDQPWFSSSLADFWGRRWNITTSTVLRTTIYDPLVEGVLVKPEAPQKQPTPQIADLRAAPATSDDSLSDRDQPTTNGHATTNGHSKTITDKNGHVRVAKWRRIAGMFGTFIASGLAHEYIINQMIEPLPGGHRPWFGKWTTYFVAQGPMLLAEVALKKWWRKRGLKPINIWVARALTITLLLLVADPFFFAPVDRDSDLAQRVIHAVVEGYNAGFAKVQPLAQQVAALLLPKTVLSASSHEL